MKVAQTIAVLLLISGSAGCAAQALPTPAAGSAPETTPFVPAAFSVPTSASRADFRLVPLSPAVVELDYAAYMSSIEHIQQTFSHSTAWPTTDITPADAMKDMESEAARFAARRSFAYAVLSPDGARERGSLYVSPSPVRGYDAVVRMWVTKADYDAGFDARLYAWAQQWIAAEWPFARVAYPGRQIPQAEWDAMVAANKAGK